MWQATPDWDAGCGVLWCEVGLVGLPKSGVQGMAAGSLISLLGDAHCPQCRMLTPQQGESPRWAEVLHK